MTDETLTPDFISETPAPEPVTILPNTTPTKVEFSPEQQALFDRKLRESHGRIARAERERVAQLEKELALMRDKAVGNAPDSSETEKLRAQIADEKLRSAAAEAKANKQAKEILQQKLAVEIDAVSPQDVSKLLQDNLVSRDGKWVVVDDNGVDREGVTPEQLYREFAESRPWSIRGRTIPGQGSKPSMGFPVPPPDWTKYFSNGSPLPNTSAELNQIAMRDPKAYARMKDASMRRS